MNTQPAQINYFAIFILSTFIGLTSCISVNIGGEKTRRSEGIKLQIPGKPFESVENELVDRAWRNGKTGNSIAYLSDCGSEVGLESLKSKPLVGIDNLQVKNDKSMTYNGRKAYRTTYAGDVDGVQTQFDILVFGKNNCSYIINYISSPSAYEKDLQAFETFIANFEAP